MIEFERRHPRARLAGVLWVALLALACAAAEGPSPKPPAIPASTPALIETPILPAPPPREVSEALLPPLALAGAPAEGELAERFDLSVQGAPAQSFFLGLVEGTGYDMLVHPDVTGRISLSLRDASVLDVMRAVRDVYGYPYRQTSRGFEVMPSGLQTRIFEIHFPNLARSGYSHTRVSSGQLSSRSQSGSQDGTGDGGATSSKGRSTSGTLIATESDADVWGELLSSLRVLLGDGDGRSVVMSPQTGTVVVRAMSAELAAVAAYLQVANRNLRRQVILEARILEVRLDDGFQAGINWAQLISHNGDTGLFGQTGGGTILDKGTSEIAGATGDLDPRLADVLTGTAASAFGGVFSLAISAGKFSTFIELLETQGEVRTLSSPRISTLNNQKAVIKVGSDEFFVTDVSTTTVTGTTTTTNPDITLTPFFSGIALDVTPHINSSAHVILHVHPSVSEVEDQTKEITVGGQIQTLPLAFSRIRESDSVVAARSGQVVVIGGLMQDNQADKRAGTPWISRLPLLGSLFRQTRTASQKSELVILLRPTVVGEDTWQRSFRAARQRYRSASTRDAPPASFDPFQFDGVEGFEE